MFKGSNQVTKYKRGQILLGALLKYALLAAFALFYTLAPYYVPTGFSEDTRSANSSIPKDLSRSSSKTVFSSYHFPAADSGTVNFIKEDSKDDESRLFWVYFSGYKFLESYLDLLYIPIQDLIQSRHAVPLFVLYHSWKSFLFN